MHRSVLTWTLTAAFLVTFPVTGAGPCPCRLVKPLPSPTAKAPTPVPVLPPKCKCCYEPHGDTTPSRPEDDHRKQTPAPPTDGPCDHHFAVDSAVAGGPGQWLEESRGLWDANPAVDAGGHAASCLATDAVTATVELTPAPHPCAHIRYAHAFRC